MVQDTQFRPQKVALAGGFLALALGVATAYRTPASGYEFSIYAATPATYWVGVAVAAAAGLWVALTGSGRVRDGGHAVGAVALLSVVALPLLRGYHFYGRGDALTHLGWAREIDAGTLSPLQNLYPGIHLTASFVHELTGIELPRALLLLPVAVFPLAFVAFTALCVAFVSRRSWAPTIGLFTALLFVPINQISVFTEAHPSSQSILFVPVVLYLLFRYLYAPSGRLGVLTASGLLFGVAGLALVFFHPQETMNFLALLGAVALVQLLYRRYRDGHPIATHRTVYGHVALLAVVFLGWTFRYERARARVRFVAESLVAGGSALEQTGGRVTSLQALGGSVEEVFLKLFGVALLLGAIAAVLFVRSVLGSHDATSPRRHALVTYLGAGLIPLVAMFTLIFAAQQGDHFFRFLGFILVPITILGAVGITGGAEWLGGRASGWHVVVALCVLFALLIPAQAAVYHKSPYMYQENKQVSEAAMSGHTTAFDLREEETTFMSLRSGPSRWVDGVYGRERAQTDLEFAGYRSGVPAAVFNQNLSTAYEDDRYLAVHEAQYQREVQLLGGLRYDTERFDRLEAEPRISRVQTNGDFRLYRIDGTDA